MNLTEALETSLPEIPALAKDTRPRIHPNLIWRERTENGKTTITALVPGKGLLYRFSPQQWDLVQLFDGNRTIPEVADLYLEQSGIVYTPEQLQESIAGMGDFWYKTPLEQNVALKQRLAGERQKRIEKKSKYGDVSHMEFGVWDPDRILTWAYPKLRFLYSRWYAVFSIVAFAWMMYIFYDRWDLIGRDTFLFFNFREKSFTDIVGFWLLAAVVLFFHECGHALTVKHYGGEVHRMGFLLIYLTPAFFTDSTEVFVYGEKWQRVNTVVWGAWAEMQICWIATLIWWGTPPGGVVHEAAYFLVLITGLAVFFFNWNPLIKLDGYYILTEMLGWPDLKEESTAYVSAWVKKHVWKLPVEVPFVPQQRRFGYVTYALASGVYSYGLLYLFARFVGNIATSISPDWGFLAGIAVAYRIFRSRIRTLVRFMRTLYLDKKEWLQRQLPPRRRLIGAIVLLVFAFLPIWRESVGGRFILEPVQRAVLRSEVPGYVEAVNVREGQQVAAGTELIHLRNLALETRAARAEADARVAAARATQAQLRWEDFGRARLEQDRLREESRVLSDQLARLRMRSPFQGVVLSPRPQDWVGSYAEAGSELLEIADTSRMRARVYVAEADTKRAALGASARLLCDSSVLPIQGSVVTVAPAAYEIEPGLMAHSTFKGIRLPNYFVYDIVVDNPDGELRSGMAGRAKIFGKRRSLAALFWEPVGNFLGRKIW
jgi:putative peptide zinc metalloprotease protein